MLRKKNYDMLWKEEKNTGKKNVNINVSYEILCDIFLQAQAKKNTLQFTTQVYHNK